MEPCRMVGSKKTICMRAQREKERDLLGCFGKAPLMLSMEEHPLEVEPGVASRHTSHSSRASPCCVALLNSLTTAIEAVAPDTCFE
eukprot:2623628-Amphidinium_carterae.1